MPIYTHPGNNGCSSLPGRTRRLPKSHPLFSLLGDLDELNSLLGIVSSLNPQPQTQQLVFQIQTTLFLISSELASPSFPSPLTPLSLHQLDRQIKKLNRNLPSLKNFIYPQGTLPATFLFLARAVTRRAERSFIIQKSKIKNQNILAYLNRLSDLLFTLARFENHQAKAKESVWKLHRP